MSDITIVDFDIYITSDVSCPAKLVMAGTDNPVDLTGKALTMQVRGTPESTLIFEASTTNGLLTVTDAAEGEILFEWAVEDIEHIYAGEYTQGLLMSQGSLRTDLWRGSFKARRGVARITE